MSCCLLSSSSYHLLAIASASAWPSRVRMRVALAAVAVEPAWATAAHDPKGPAGQGCR